MANRYAILLENSKKTPPQREDTPPLQEEIKKELSIEPENASLLANKQSSKEVKMPSMKKMQFTKDKKKYGTYLREDSIVLIQVHAIQTKRKDHEVLQEAVDLFFKNQK